MMKTDQVMVAAEIAAIPDTVFNCDEALERVEGDSELLAEIVQLFLDSHTEKIWAARAGVESGETETVRRAAHAFKGAIGNFAAREAFGAARELESAAFDRDLLRMRSAYLGLEAALERLKSALLCFLQRNACCPLCETEVTKVGAVRNGVKGVG